MPLRCALAVVVFAVAASAVQPLWATDPFGRLPLAFEENRGQFDRRVDFAAHGRAYNVLLTRDGAILDGRAKGHTPLRIALAGGNASAPAGMQALPGHANYYTLSGNRTVSRQENVPTWSRVRYASVYPGIDVVYYGNDRRLEYDFVVAPGARADAIRLRFDGAKRVWIDRSGDLLVAAPGAVIRQRRPLMYQEVNGARRVVAGRYVRRGANEIAFAVGRYDRRRPLVIDPVVVTWAVPVGGTSTDFFNAVAVDAAGCTYVTGQTRSADYPAVFGPDFTAGDYALIISKVAADGTTLLYSTYFNQSGSYNVGNDIKVDAAGEVYVAGTYVHRAIVIRLDGTGTQKYTNLLGATFDDGAGNSIAIDGTGYAWVTGKAGSSFPTTPGAFQTTCGDAPSARTGDAFVAKVDTDASDNSSIVYSTFLGGSSGDEGRRIEVDSTGAAYVTGTTWSPDFPMTANGYQQTFGGDISDVFVSKLNASGSSLLYSTYLGGTFFDTPYGLAVDTAHNVYVGGSTKDDFPTTPGVVQPVWNIGTCPTTNSPFNACADGFVAKLNPAASSAQASLIWSTYLGGTLQDWVSALRIDSLGTVYLVGRAESTNFPQVNPLAGMSGSGFVAQLNSTGTSILFSSYYEAVPDGLARDGASGALFLTGGVDLTVSDRDGFITKIEGLPADAATAPSITTQPQSSTIGPAAAAALSVVATGTIPLAYQWYRGPSGTTSSPIAGATLSSYTTPALTSTTRYWVRVSNAAGHADSVTAKVTVSFTNDPLAVGVTPVRAAHITELRTRINALRTRGGLAAYPWFDATLAAGVTVRAVHVTDLRTALAQAYIAAGLAAPTYSDPSVAAGELVPAAHIAEVRTAVATIE